MVALNGALKIHLNLAVKINRSPVPHRYSFTVFPLAGISVIKHLKEMAYIQTLCHWAGFQWSPRIKFGIAYKLIPNTVIFSDFIYCFK